MNTDGEENGADGDGNGDEPADEWAEIGSCKANEGPVWRAIWGPREYGTSVLVSIAGSVVNVWGEFTNATAEVLYSDNTAYLHLVLDRLYHRNKTTQRRRGKTRITT